MKLLAALTRPCMSRRGLNGVGGQHLRVVPTPALSFSLGCSIARAACSRQKHIRRSLGQPDPDRGSTRAGASSASNGAEQGSLPEELQAFREYLPDQQFQAQAQANAAAAAAAAAGGTLPAPPGTLPVPTDGSDPIIPPGLDLKAAADHFNMISLVMLAAGALITALPSPFLQAATNAPPTALEVIFAQLMGVALLYRGLVARVLKGAAERRRLGSTTSQRVMLGALLPALALIVVFNTAWRSWGVNWNPAIVALYPAILIAEFVTYISTFQAYNPYFLLKLFWPMAVGYFVSQLVPIPPINLEQVPAALSPITAGLAILVGRRGMEVLGRVATVALKFMRRAGARYVKKQLGAKSLNALVPEAGKTLQSTVMSKMDYTLPRTMIAWGYWVLMLSHFANMYNAYKPETLFVGTVTEMSPLLKQTWSAGFLAAAFTCDALKTAADREHLGLLGNRQLNLALILLEAAFAVVLVNGMAAGVVAQTPYAYLFTATSFASIAFLWAAHGAAKQQSDVPAVSSMEWQQAMERRPEYPKVMALAVLMMNVVTCCI